MKTLGVDGAVSQQAAQVSRAKKIHYAWIVFAAGVALEREPPSTANVALVKETFQTNYFGLVKAVDGMKESEDQLRMMIDTIPALVWSCRPDGTTD